MGNQCCTKRFKQNFFDASKDISTDCDVDIGEKGSNREKALHMKLSMKNSSLYKKRTSKLGLKKQKTAA
ncbi:unnamed protein product [Blepharisma stoltei]|uniref:Uncharacterized protein n=1 Tax=Blepharisma stoltei TaxID=1481888 RepID=A0AAU9JGU4_9CILI|nr:unnamed protein product [Blepharisma stoltei]